MAADRAQHVDEVVGPQLAAGRWVVTDRFSGSTLAYQGVGRGLDSPELRQVLAWAAGGVAADLSVLVDVDVETARGRLGVAAPDRLERLDADFFERVRARLPGGGGGATRNTGWSWTVTGRSRRSRRPSPARCASASAGPDSSSRGAAGRPRSSPSWWASRPSWPRCRRPPATRCTPTSSGAPAARATRAAARAFAAALLCPEGGCGECWTCRRGPRRDPPRPRVRGAHRCGARRSTTRGASSLLAQRRPFEAERQVLVVGDVHLALRSAPALLKTVEEPPPSTFFVLLAEDIPNELVTVASRCVEVVFPPVPSAAVEAWLRASGVAAEQAAVVAGGGRRRPRPGAAVGRRQRVRGPPRAVALGPGAAQRGRQRGRRGWPGRLLEAIDGGARPAARAARRRSWRS